MPGDFGATSPLPPSTCLALSGAYSFALYATGGASLMLTTEVKLMASPSELGYNGQRLARPIDPEGVLGL